MCACLRPSTSHLIRNVEIGDNQRNNAVSNLPLPYFVRGVKLKTSDQVAVSYVGSCHRLQTLTCICVRQAERIFHNSNFEQLTTLCMRTSTSAMPIQFPHSLEHLVINKFEQVIRTFTFGSRLTSLTLGDRNNCYNYTIEPGVLPTSLTKLVLFTDRQLLGPNILPTSVTCFELVITRLGGHLQRGVFGNCLTELVYDGPGNLGLDDLPSSLVNLSICLRGNIIFGNGFPKGLLKLLIKAGFDKPPIFPAQLLELQVHGEYPYCYPLVLPSSLRTLGLGEDMFMWMIIPENLQLLEFHLFEIFDQPAARFNINSVPKNNFANTYVVFHRWDFHQHAYLDSWRELRNTKS